MPTNLELIKYEQLANTLFIIATLFAFASGNQATQHEIEKQQDTPPSGSTATAVNSAQYALYSTLLSVASYVIYVIIATLRKSNLEQEIQAGTTSISLTPNIIIILGFTISLLGTLIRIPALQQRIREAHGVVIL